MSKALVPCPACARHVRSSDMACPFCKAAMPESAAQKAVPSATQRMGRNATFLFATTLTLAACGPGTEVKTDAAAQDGADEGGAMALYGAPVPVDAGPEAAAPGDDGSVMSLYGAPIPSDGGLTPTDAGPAPEDGGGSMALYGAPVPVDAGEGPSDGGGGGARYGAPPAIDDLV